MENPFAIIGGVEAAAAEGNSSLENIWTHRRTVMAEAAVPSFRGATKAARFPRTGMGEVEAPAMPAGIQSRWMVYRMASMKTVGMMGMMKEEKGGVLLLFDF